MTKRPQRKRKSDRLISGHHDADAIACDHAIGPLDRLALDMDRKWGIDRLSELVSPETAARYGKALAQLNEAIDENDPGKVAHKASVCMKGLRVMDAEAEAAGHQPATGDFWEYDLGGFRFAVLKDGREWKTVHDARPDLLTFTMREVALALKAYCETVPLAEVKKHFPNAQIKKLPKTKTLPSDFFASGGDPIPF